MFCCTCLSVSVGYIPKGDIDNIPMFGFRRYSQKIPKWFYQFLLWVSVYKDLSCSNPWQDLVLAVFLILAFLVYVPWWPSMVLVWIFLMSGGDIKHLFMYFFSTYIFFTMMHVLLFIVQFTVVLFISFIVFFVFLYIG